MIGPFKGDLVSCLLGSGVGDLLGPLEGDSLVSDIGKAVGSIVLGVMLSLEVG